MNLKTTIYIYLKYIHPYPFKLIQYLYWIFFRTSFLLFSFYWTIKCDHIIFRIWTICLLCNKFSASIRYCPFPSSKYVFISLFPSQTSPLLFLPLGTITLYAPTNRWTSIVNHHYIPMKKMCKQYLYILSIDEKEKKTLFTYVSRSSLLIERKNYFFQFHFLFFCTLLNLYLLFVICLPIFNSRKRGQQIVKRNKNKIQGNDFSVANATSPQLQ